MATADYGLAKLDLAGNRILWNSNDINHNVILLEGAHFHDIVPMATLVISCLCGLSFFAILIGGCCVCNRRNAAKFLPWSTVWVPVLCMIAFFAIDITNRIFHELERKISTYYIGIDIAMGSMASIADGILMVYFMKHSPVDFAHAGRFAVVAMLLATGVFWIISTATKGIQIWNLLTEAQSNTGSQADTSDDDPRFDALVRTSLIVFQDLDTTANGMELLFAIGFAVLAANFLRHLSKSRTLRKRLSIGVAALAASFLVRNMVEFIFTLIYVQYNKVAGLGVQLTYMTFYGVLSVVVFGCIVSVAAVQEEEDNQPTYGPVAQTAGSDQEANWNQPQTKSDVKMAVNPMGYGRTAHVGDHGHF